MNFDQPYNRHEFVSFLRQDFLPENDFVQEETPVAFPIQTQYCCDIATKLGTCQSLDLVIYEIRHHSKSDARVGMSKEAFRLNQMHVSGCLKKHSVYWQMSLKIKR